MKIKRDFITNSSTTCYITIGFEMTKEELKNVLNLEDNMSDNELYTKVVKYINNENIYIGFGEMDYAYTDNHFIFGKRFMEDDYIEFDFDEINTDEIKEVKRILSYKGKIKVTVGTVCE